MRRKLPWLITGSLVVAAIVLASCGSATPTTPISPTTPTTPTSPTSPTAPTTAPTSAGAEMVKVTLKKMDGTSVEKLVEKPKYGGVVRTAITADPYFFDFSFRTSLYTWSIMLTNEPLYLADWRMGPGGTGDLAMAYFATPPYRSLLGVLAESWEIPNLETLIFHIRKGVRFQNKPPTNGREMTADDVVYSINYAWGNPMSTAQVTYPKEKYIESVTATDKWTVVIKCKPGKGGNIFERAGGNTPIIPRDVVDKYGDMRDWKNACGTGPFVLTDYVAGSSLVFQRNPDYWMKDPLFPNNSLPYLDTFRRLIIPDASTRLAAIRTSKIDIAGGLFWEDAADLKKTAPQLKWYEFQSVNPPALYMRIDRPTLPQSNVKVRRALTMAIDRNEITKLYYGGHATTFSFPISAVGESMDLFTPLEQLPKSVQELYTYNPENAKKLLAEAGYPNGFNSEVLTIKDNQDLLSLIASYWSKIGVNLKIDVREAAVVQSIASPVKQNDMYMTTLSNLSMITGFYYIGVGAAHNYSAINDPRIEAAREAVQAAYLDRSKVVQIWKELTPYLLDQAYFIPMPAPTTYNTWWPWVKNYGGETMIGQDDMGWWGFPRYIWVDQDLREKMTGSR